MFKQQLHTKNASPVLERLSFGCNICRADVRSEEKHALPVSLILHQKNVQLFTLVKKAPCRCRRQRHRSLHPPQRDLRSGPGSLVSAPIVRQSSWNCHQAVLSTHAFESRKPPPFTWRSRSELILAHHAQRCATVHNRFSISAFAV